MMLVLIIGLKYDKLEWCLFFLRCKNYVLHPIAERLNAAVAWRSFKNRFNKWSTAALKAKRFEVHVEGGWPSQHIDQEKIKRRGYVKEARGFHEMQRSDRRGEDVTWIRKSNEEKSAVIWASEKTKVPHTHKTPLSLYNLHIQCRALSLSGLASFAGTVCNMSLME